ncbi:MAG: icmP [Gammaproteobacteria bacterium]|jgi:intracellular multiplication protein IcmP|nr:icmP [Gammaproteobacteria bacterium]
MPPAPQDQQQNEQALSPLWIALGLFVALLIIWQIGHVYIAMLVIKIKLFETQLISLFTNNLQTQLHWLKTVNPANLKPNDLAELANLTGEYLRYPVIIFLIILSILLFFGNSVSNYRRIYSMQTLLEEEKHNWPQIAPVVNLNLLSQDIEKGPWAMSMTATIFAKHHQLLVEEPEIPNSETISHKRKLRYALLKDEATRVFSLQMGKYWTSADDLSIHAKALFAIFAAKANHDRTASTDLLNQIAASALVGKLDFTGVQELLDKYKNSKAVQKIVSKHAYILTALASLLELARRDGVLATAEFLWLKPVDRRLWYMLNNVGRQTAFVETAGPFSHWLAERAIGHKLLMPMIEPAVNGLDNALKEFAFTLEDEG